VNISSLETRAKVAADGALPTVAVVSEAVVAVHIIYWAKAGAAINAAVRPSNTVFFIGNLLKLD